MQRPRWSRRYLTLDRYMAGDFRRLLFWLIALFTLLFVAAWLIGWWLAGWNIGDAFVNLTNPQRNPAYDGSEWPAIVIANILGLIILQGILLTVLVNWVSNRRGRHLNGEARYDYVFKRPHAVILGGHPITANIAKDLIESGRQEFVVVQTAGNPENLRRAIRAMVKAPRQSANVIIYSGSRTSWHELEQLYLDTASEIYIIGEPREIDGDSLDALNLQSWSLIAGHYGARRGRRIDCHVMLEHPSSFTAFQFTDIPTEQNSLFRFLPFGLYENWARQLLTGNSADREAYYNPLDGTDGISFSSSERVHLVIMGWTEMGKALALETAHTAHYPNFLNSDAGNPRTLITIIDPDARTGMLKWQARYQALFQLARHRLATAESMDTPWVDPLLDPDSKSPYAGDYLGYDFIDVDFEFIEGNYFDPHVRQYLSEGDMKEKTTIAVTLPDASEALSAALSLPEAIYSGALQIWVYQKQSGAMVDALAQGSTGVGHRRFGKLRPFGMLDKCDYTQRVHQKLPMMVWFAYHCLDEGLDPLDQLRKLEQAGTLEATLQQVWDALTNEGGKSEISKRLSNTYCANTFPAKLRGVRKAVEERHPMPEELLGQVEHNRWVMEQLLTGMRPVGPEYAHALPIEDCELRRELKSRGIHPDLVSNSRLGTTQAYDLAIVRLLNFSTQL